MTSINEATLQMIKCYQDSCHVAVPLSVEDFFRFRSQVIYERELTDEQKTSVRQIFDNKVGLPESNQTIVAENQDSDEREELELFKGLKE